MSLFTKLVLGVIGAYVLFRLAMFAFIAFLFWPDNPTAYADSISVDPKTYENVESVDRTDFEIRSYAYERNQFVDVLTDSITPPKLADAYGRLPVFKFEGDVFIILHKWLNESAGLAISEDPAFKSKIESIDLCFRVRHVKNTIYAWEFDGERPRPYQE